AAGIRMPDIDRGVFDRLTRVSVDDEKTEQRRQADFAFGDVSANEIRGVVARAQCRRAGQRADILRDVQRRGREDLSPRFPSVDSESDERGGRQSSNQQVTAIDHRSSLTQAACQTCERRTGNGASQNDPASKLRSHRLTSIPPPKPVSEPFDPITRWQGMMIGTGLAPFAAPTARVAVGRPIDLAI